MNFDQSPEKDLFDDPGEMPEEKATQPSSALALAARTDVSTLDPLHMYLQEIKNFLRWSRKKNLIWPVNIVTTKTRTQPFA